uniref:Sodium channel epithelial 1 gamma subunit n=1 Tax=Podarcis muralis TaxID=64176 RepID=A0A670KFI7_PODMU
MAPAKKIKAKLKKTLPVTGPQAPTLRELMHWYCMNTNTHGCRRIVVSRGRLRRFLWILLTLTAVGLILWYCTQLVLNYYKASVSVTVQFHALPFPAVTICNINPYKYSAIKKHLAELDKETENALRSLYDFSGSNIRERRDAGDPEPSEDRRFHRYFPLMNLDNLTHQQPFPNPSSGSKRRMEANIISGGSSIVSVKNPQDIVGFQLVSRLSDCALYTFSSGVNAIQEWYKLHYMNIMAQISAEEKVNMSYSAEELILSCFFDGRSCDARNFTTFHHPMHGNCYTFNSGQNGSILNTTTGGSEYGLQVILYINEAEYNPFLVTSTGAKIVIHGQDEYPFIEDVGTEIETATATSIGMHFTKSKRLGYPYSNCKEDGSDVNVKKLYKNKTYSLQTCLHSCFQNEMVKKCGCAQYAQPLPDNAEFCNYKKYPDWSKSSHHSTCPLLQRGLNLKEWTLTTSLAQWPSSASQVSVSLPQVLFALISLCLGCGALSPVILVSNIGGQLGLWMSCSMVCVIEIVEVFFLDTICIILRRHWQKAKKWWRGKNREQEEEEEEEEAEAEAESTPQNGLQGHDNPACTADDDDLPTFNTAMRLPLSLEHPPPRTPPPNYSTLRLASTFPEQLDDTLEVRTTK